MIGILNGPEELAGLLAVAGFFGALMGIIASLVFLPSSKPAFKPLPPQVLNGPVMAPGLYGAPQQQQQA
jgi:hypothetical protein